MKHEALVERKVSNVIEQCTAHDIDGRIRSIPSFTTQLSFSSRFLSECGSPKMRRREALRTQYN
jgi:hypothetical protein